MEGRELSGLLTERVGKGEREKGGERRGEREGRERREREGVRK